MSVAADFVNKLDKLGSNQETNYHKTNSIPSSTETRELSKQRWLGLTRPIPATTFV